MRRAGRVVAEMLAVTAGSVRPGIRTAELDRLAREVLARRGARSNFLGYGGGQGVAPFPAVICTSPNNVVVHGIPGDYVLQEGDIISLDCGAIIEWYHGDAAVTVAVGKTTALAEKLMRATQESLMAGIGQLVEGNRLHDVGFAVQTVAEGAGFSVVRGYVGHSIGTKMHEDPQVPNYWPGTPGPKLRSGMVFAVEPMVNAGSHETVQLDDGWTVVTADGSLAAHFEHTIAVTDDGPEILTVAD